MYIKTNNKEVGANLAAYYQAGKPIEIMGKSFLGTSIGFEYPDSRVEFHGSEVSKVAWTGEGLPPVGTLCEWKEKTGFSWVKATVLFITDSSVVMQRGDGFEWQMMTARTVFRPIRTPEQIAEEARENELNRMVATVSMLDKGWARKVCAGLYDAGYRKQDNADERK